jgi:hypothetical protein
MRWILILMAVVVNTMAIIIALSPQFVTYANIVPQGINCVSCSSPEIQQALIKSAIAGRAQVLGVLSSGNWWLLGIAIFNVFAVIGALFIPTLTHHSSGTPSGAP